MDSWEQSALWDLRWHWGSAYRIWLSDGHWYASKDGKVLQSSEPGRLRDMIRKDYGQRGCPAHLVIDCPDC